MQKNNDRLKKLKRKKKKKKVWETPQNCKSPVQRQRFITTAVKIVTEKNKQKQKNLKSLIRFQSGNKIKNYKRGRGEKKEKEKAQLAFIVLIKSTTTIEEGKRKKSEKKFQKNLQNKS